MRNNLGKEKKMGIHVEELLKGMVDRFDSEIASGISKEIQYRISGDAGGNYYIRIKNDEANLFEGESEEWNLRINVDADTWIKIASGEMEGPQAVGQGKLIPEGDMELLMQIKNIFGRKKPNDIWTKPGSVKVRNEIDEVEKLSPQSLAELQQRNLVKLVTYARENSPFYRKLYDHIDVGNLKITDLPAINKKMVMDNFDDIITDYRVNLQGLKSFLSEQTKYGVLYKDEFIVGATSGTTGTPGIFVYNSDAWRRVVLSNRRGMTKLRNMEREGIISPDGGTGEPSRFAIVSTPTPASLSCATIEHLPAWLVTTKIFSVLDPIEKLVAQLNEFQPEILCGYANALCNLAYEQMAGRLHISLNRVSPFGEFLTQSMRETLEKGFNAAVYNRYQASEMMNIGWECDMHEGMHISSDLVIIESVDENNVPVPAGERGAKVLATNLYNYTQPLIRYEIRDMVTISPKKCSCGLPFPLIECVEGRTDDVLRLKNDKGETVPINPIAIEMKMSEVKGIQGFQIIQENENTIDIKAVIPENTASVISRIKEVFYEELLKPQGCSRVISISVSPVASLERDQKTGKFRQIINKSPQSAAEAIPELVGSEEGRLKAKHILQSMADKYTPDEAVAEWYKILQFDFSDRDDVGDWHLIIENGACTLHEGIHAAPTITILCSSELWGKIVNAEVTVHTSYIEGEWRARGDTTILPHLHRVFPRTKKDSTETIFDIAVKAEEMDVDQLLKIQQEKLVKMVKFAVEHSPFYKNLYKGIDPENVTLDKLPIINRKMVMSNFDAVVTDDRVTLRELREYLADESTIGKRFKDEFAVIVPNNDDTGEKGIFVYDSKNWGIVVVSEMRGIRRFQALSAGTGKEKNPTLANICCNLRNTTGFRLTDVDCASFAIVKAITFPSRQPVTELVKQLNVFQPEVLCIYTREIMALAREQIKGNLKIAPTMVIYLTEPPDQIYFADESYTLDERPDRDLIYQAFGRHIDIFERFIPPETTVVGWECEAHSGLHLNIDRFSVELMDDHYNPVETGKMATKMVVSNLINTTMPIIRYEIPVKSYMKKEKCSCGRPHPLLEIWRHKREQ
ncbi:MAG: SCP2 sterol-binding domain-containing protein [Desulfobacteraceae bacterium]